MRSGQYPQQRRPRQQDDRYMSRDRDRYSGGGGSGGGGGGYSQPRPAPAPAHGAARAFNPSLLDGKPLEEQKEIIGEFIYVRAQELYPDKAEKIAGMMLEFDFKLLIPAITNATNLDKNINDAATLIARS
jgi:hypothetical protein